MDKVLKELKKLKNIYFETIDAEIGKELKLKLKLISSEEEAQVHAYASSFEQGLGYLYAIKKETLCRAIIGINGKDIPDFIDSDENKDEKLERHGWLRKNIISGWNQILIDEVYSYYAELVTRLEEKIKKNVKKEEEE